MAIITLTEPQRDYLVGLLKIGHGTLVAIDKALPDARRRDRRELLAEREKIANDVRRLEWVLSDGS